MKKSIQNIFNNYWVLILMLSLSCIIIFYPFLFEGKNFEFQADQQLQYHLFYQEWLTMLKTFIKSGTLPFYSWHTFLGTDFFASKLYYCTGDYFLPFILLLSGTTIQTVQKFLTIILIFMSAFSMNLYLRQMNIKNNKTLIIISYLYAVCGISTLYFGQYMFHRFYAILPILFLSVERYLKSGKLSLFTFVVFVLLFQSYYFMFSTSWFLVLYFIFSYSLKHPNFKFRIMLKSALKLILAFLCGVLLSAVMLLPTIIYILNSSRIGSTDITTLTWNIKVLIGFIYSFIIPPFNMFTNIPYPFYYGYNGHAHWYSIFTSAISIFLLISMFLNKNIKHRKNYLTSLIVILAFVLILPLNSIIHGFSEPSFRWIFLLVFFILLIDAKVLDHYWEHPIQFKKILTKAYLTWILIILIASVIGFKTNILNISEYKYEFIALFLMMLLFTSYYLLLKFNLKLFIIPLIFIEATISSAFLIHRFADDYYYYTPSLNKEYVQYFQSIDEDLLYRIYIDPDYLLPTSTMNLNQSLQYGYLSTTTYDSTYESILTPFLNYIGINWHIIDISNTELLQLLGVKYIGVYNENELDANFEYEYAYDLNAFHMYQLVNYNHLGHTFNKFIVESSISDNSDIDWNNELIVNQELFDVLTDCQVSEKQQLIITSQNNQNNFNGNISVEDKCILFISIPYSSGWTVYDNGVKTATYNVDGGFMGIILEEGDHNLEFNYTTPGFWLGLSLSAFGFIGFVYLVFVDHKKSKTKIDERIITIVN